MIPEWSQISALVVAAGLSRRMGSFKLLLPWRERTVIEQVIRTLGEAGVWNIAVVTGHRAAELEAAVAGSGVRCVFNPRYAEGEMISSLQAGLAALSAVEPVCCAAALVCLGDQPQMIPATVRAVLEAGAAGGWEQIVIPSYEMHAGHPILLPRTVWPDVLSTQQHLRAVITAHRDRVTYVAVDTPTILADLDTPEDYARR